MENLNNSFFDLIGLKDVVPSVKKGLDEIKNKGEFENEILGIAAKFKTDLMSVARSSNKLPPLGKFQTPSDQPTSLSSKMMNEFLEALKNLYQQKRTLVEIDKESFLKISNLFVLIKGMFDNFSHFDKRASLSIYSKMKL